MRHQLLRLVVVFIVFTGCEEYVAVDVPKIAVVERDYILAFVLDTSGSFTYKMFDGDEIAYKFFLRSTDQFFRNGAGNHANRVLISQLSGNSRTLLWEGSPLALRNQFQTSAAIKQFVVERSDPAASRVYGALADTLNYLVELPGVRDGKTELCVLVLSDMLDTTSAEEERNMQEALGRFAKTNSAIGFYWVDQFRLNDCRKWLVDAGVKDFIVEGEFVADPSLPFSEP
jgi:hypothetical protein